MTGRGGTAGSVGFLIANSQGKQLLPVIPQELARGTYNTVSSVIPSCGHVHRHARVDSRPSQTVVLIKHFPCEGVEAIAAYFMKGDFCRELPLISRLDRGIPSGAAIVSLDGGKVYVLGGHMEHDSTLDDRGRHVYVIDLGGEMQWTRCASMRKSREKFGCGSMDGKIYVFVGISGDKCVFGSEIYDPMQDAWFQMKPMKYLRYNHQVERVDEELFVNDGKVYHYFDSEGRIMQTMSDSEVSALDNGEINFVLAEPARTWEAYHPGRDEWRVVPHLGRDGPLNLILFMAKGKLHGMCPLGIWVYDTATNAWARIHRHSFPDIASDTVPFIYTVAFPYAVKAVDDELLAVVNWQNRRGIRESRLVRSTGLGSQKGRIEWRKYKLLFASQMICLIYTEHSFP